MRRLAPAAICLLLCAGAIAWLSPKNELPGIRAPREPLQQSLGADAPSFTRNGWELHALATYDLTARLLQKKRYYGGAAAELAPYDFAVGWGLMSDPAILKQLTISQGNRFFFWEYARQPPAPLDQIVCHAANMHLVPASSEVQRALWWASAGELVHLTGYLIQAERPGYGVWRSSLTRTDTGNGACELMWVGACEGKPAAF